MWTASSVIALVVIASDLRVSELSGPQLISYCVAGASRPRVVSHPRNLATYEPVLFSLAMASTLGSLPREHMP